MTIVPYKSHHLEGILQELRLPSFGHTIMTTIDRPGHMLTALNPFGKPVCVSGVLHLHEGHGEAISYLLPQAKEEGYSLHRAVVKGLARIQSEFKYHRIQMHVELGNHTGYTWAFRLGFKWEGVMPLWTSDKRTFVRFGKYWL